MPEKVDVKHSLPTYRARRDRFDVITVPPQTYLAVDGHGDPNISTAYADALGALYPAAYRLKFSSRGALGRDYVVPPLEGLWWADDMAAFTTSRDKRDWHWTMMILVPEWIPDALVAEAIGETSNVGHRRLDEGLCMQTLHVGPFDDEGPVLERMHHDLIPARGLRLSGTHHEIYLSDPRRTAPARLRTILRQPVEAI